MNEIVCATRGGEGSRAVQLAAIARAKQTQQPLVFLYVVSPGRLGKVDHTLETAVREELIWMGKALLHIAHRRAVQAGLQDVQLVVREGNDVQAEICAYLREFSASVLMLGAPRATTTNIFGDDAVERFAQQVHETADVPVEIIHPEDVP